MLVELALEAAQKIVAGMPIQPKIVEAVVREALAQVEDSAEITMHLNPDDLVLLRKHQSPILQGLPETGPVRFTTSAEVTRGGCMVRHPLRPARRPARNQDRADAAIPVRMNPAIDTPAFQLDSALRRLRQTRATETSGRVAQIIGLVIESEGPIASVGEVCRIESARHDGSTLAEVVGFRNDHLL